MSRFINKIVITGGTSGIGLSGARQFIKEGANVVVIGRNRQALADAQKEIGAKGIAAPADVTKLTALDSLFQLVYEKYGQLDVIYANAEIARRGTVGEVTAEAFDDSPGIL